MYHCIFLLLLDLTSLHYIWIPMFVCIIYVFLAGPKLINWVLDITIAYPEGKPLDLPTIITGWREPCKTYLFYRIFNMAEVSSYFILQILFYLLMWTHIDSPCHFFVVKNTGSKREGSVNKMAV